MDADARPGGRIDRVAVTGALVALAGASLAPFAVLRLNRIVAGTPYPASSGGAAGWALVMLGVLALVAAVAPLGARRGAACLACASGIFAALAWALARAAVALSDGAPGFARVSIGGGAWLVAAGAGIVWLAGLRMRPARVWVVSAALAAVIAWAVAAAVGGLGRLSIFVEYAVQGPAFWQAVGTHLTLVGAALVGAILVGLPLGVASARVPRVRAVALGVVGVIQTVPSPALLGLLVVPLAAIGLPGIGPLPALIALTSYALLPIVRNTYLGLAGVDAAVVDAGRGMGMSRTQLLLRVEAPLAMPLFIEGVRAATVMVVGIAAVVAFIGVGTLGVLVFEGWGNQADDLILLGAVPMVVLAVAADTALRWLGRVATSPGIRMETS
jgi:osmoprotectant transport system permease protein